MNSALQNYYGNSILLRSEEFHFSLYFPRMKISNFYHFKLSLKNEIVRFIGFKQFQKPDTKCLRYSVKQLQKPDIRDLRSSSSFFKNKRKGFPEILSNYVLQKPVTSGLRDPFKLLQKQNKSGSSKSF